MTKTVSAVFTGRDQAEQAVAELRNQGFSQEISILAKGEEEYKGQDRNTNFTGGDSLSDGATTGGFIGGLAGLAVGAGALIIPGLGPIVAAGPIAGLLSGAATGGIAGGLIDFGIPEADGKTIENEVREGAVVALVQTTEDKAGQAETILKNNGANETKTYVK